MEIVVLACRGLLALVFVTAALGKVVPGAFAEFVGAVEQTRLVPRTSVRSTWPRFVAAGVVLAELAAGVLVVLPWTSVGGARLAAGLLVAFLGVIVRSLVTGSAAACRCFGPASPLGPRHVVRNAVLLLACAGALPAVGELRPSDAPAVALAAVCALVAALLVVRLDDVLDLIGPAAGPEPRGYRP